MDGRRCILDPHGTVRIFHDLVSIVVLAIDILSAPMILAWSLEVEGLLLVLSLVSLCFWSFDIFVSFSTGHYRQSDGEFESRPAQVAQKYVKSWFLPDVAIVLADVITLAMGGAEDS